MYGHTRQASSSLGNVRWNGINNLFSRHPTTPREVEMHIETAIYAHEQNGKQMMTQIPLEVCQLFYLVVLPFLWLSLNANHEIGDISCEWNVIVKAMIKNLHKKYRGFMTIQFRGETIQSNMQVQCTFGRRYLIVPKWHNIRYGSTLDQTMTCGLHGVRQLPEFLLIHRQLALRIDFESKCKFQGIVFENIVCK